jgi:mannose-6-phosphate isomerase-like protein (cupin superfamily)
VNVPYRVEKPWGYELIWARTDRYVGKILHIEPGHLLSLQYHEVKDETIHVLRGEIIFRVREGDELTERRMTEGESYHVTPRTVHQMEAVTPADLLEASTPEVDDVVRLKDRYGRVGERGTGDGERESQRRNRGS